MKFFNIIYNILSYPFLESKNLIFNIYENYLPSILNIEEFIWSEETAWIITLIGGCSALIEFYIAYKIYEYYYPKKDLIIIEENKINNSLEKSFFYFKMPTETNIGIYVGPIERDLLTYNCLLTRSLAGRLDQENQKYLQKIPYERITYLYEEALLHKKLLINFFGKIEQKKDLITFFRIKEKIINEKFYSYQLYNKKLLNKDWYNFKGYYVKAADFLEVNLLINFNFLSFFLLLSFFTLTIFILFIISNKINNIKINN